jgi:ATP-binding protein involved in chromosome partitioning
MKEQNVITEKDIINALHTVLGPDGKTPLPSSGALSGLTTVGSKVFVSIAIDAARQVEMEPMRRNAEAALRALPGVTNVAVTLTADRPQGAGAPSGGPGPKAQAATKGQAIPGIARIIAVASGKGGVGKSTTAVNLALALSARGWRVGVLDADIYGPSLPRLFGLTGKPQPATGADGGKKMLPLEAYGLKVMSIGFLVAEDTAMIWRGPMVMSALTQMMRDVVWGELDCLIVDMPPGTGDAQLTMAQGVPLAGAVIVSTPQDLALLDARRGIAMFQKVAVPVLGIVENMSYFLCPHCGGRSDIFAHGGARHEAERLGVPFLGEVPLHMTIREMSDAGRPIVAQAPQGEHAAAYLAIADQVMGRLEGAQRAAPRIVIQ